jgi:hypothetical protein
MKRIISILFLVLSSNFLFSQTTRHVNSATGNDANAGTLAAPYKTFHKAYTVAVSGDIINLTGTFDWTATDETGDVATSGYTISKNLTIQGQGASNTIVQAHSARNTADRRVFTLSGGYAITIKNLTIRHGKITSNTQSGAGIFLNSTTHLITLENLIIEENVQTGASGGQYFGGGGIGIYNHSNSADINILNCQISNNSTTSWGGGIYTCGVDPYSSNPVSTSSNITQIRNCTFSGNVSSGHGAAIAGYYGRNFVLINSTLSANSGSTGVTFSNHYTGSLYLLNNTIAYNTVAFNSVTFDFVNSATLQNNIIVENRNSSNDLQGYIIQRNVVPSYYNNVIDLIPTNWAASNDVQNGVNGNIVGTNLTLGLSNTLGLNSSTNITRTLAISCASVATNAGSNVNYGYAVPSVDQRGSNRNGNVDIGSFENQGGSEIAYNGNLTAFSKCGSSPSANQSFTVLGCNLTANISITAPTGFEISTNASSGFGSSLTLTQSGGSVASTTIFIRMTAAATGSPSGNISLASTGATTIDRSVSGTAASLSVGTASSSQVVCHNTNAADITLSGSSGTIQWQRSSDNSAWTPISAATGTTLTATQIGAITSTTFIRAQVTSGSCTGNSNTVTLEVNNALAFDGTGDFVNIGNNASLNFTSNFTIESWVYVPASPKYSINTIFSKNEPGNGTPGYMFGFNHWNTTNLFLVLEDAVGGISSNKTVTTGAWNHVAVVISSNGTVGTFYINGSNAGGGTVNLSNASSVNEFIGSMDASGSYFLQGSLDELRIWNVARTQQEIIDNMDNPLTGSESGLVAYYDFDQGIPGGNNTGITSVLNKTANSLNGTFSGISRSGTTSNFVDGNHATIVSSDYGCVNGNSARMIVGASGRVPSSIQWYRNTTNSTTGATLLTGSTSQVFNTDANESSTKFYYATIAGTCAASSNSNIISLQNPVVTGTLDVYEDNTTQLSCSDATAASTPWVSLNPSLLTTSNTGLITGVYPGAGRVVYTTNAGCKDTVTVNVHETEWIGSNNKDIAVGSNWKLNSRPTIIKKIRFNNNAVNNLILSSRTVVDSIDFGTSNRQIELGDNDLIVNHIKNFNSSRYIKTIGAGKVKKQLTNNTSFTFPVGNKAYNPITITNKTGTADSFSVNILDTAYLNGSTSGNISNPYVKRTWNISKNTASANAGSGVDLTFNWNANEVVGTLTNPTLNHHNGSGWKIPTMGTTNVSGNSLTYTGYKGTFSPFAIGGSNVVALPVELKSFIAECHSDYVQVNWTTASEIRNKSFELYKSENAQDWKLIHTTEGQGDKATETDYSYMDMDKQSTYYRLKDLDFDGIENWSPIIFADCKSETSDIQIYPNPTSDFIKVIYPFEEQTTLNILSLEGKILKTIKLVSNNNIIDIKDLSTGVYIIEINGKTASKTIKIIKE